MKTIKALRIQTTVLTNIIIYLLSAKKTLVTFSGKASLVEQIPALGTGLLGLLAHFPVTFSAKWAGLQISLSNKLLWLSLEQQLLQMLVELLYCLGYFLANFLGTVILLIFLLPG